MSKDYEFKENGLTMKFRVTEQGRALLLRCAGEKESPVAADDARAEKDQEAFYAVELELSGGQFNDHHGAKKTRSDAAARLRFVRFRDEREELGRHIVLFQQSDEAEVESHYLLVCGSPVIRAWTVITAKKSVDVEYLSSFRLCGVGAGRGRAAYDETEIGIPHNAWHGEGQWRFGTLADHGLTACHDEFYMKKLSYGNTGSWSSKEYLPQGMLRHAKSTLFWQIEHNGSWYAELGNLRGFLYLSLFGPTFAEGHWRKRLEPGESFASVPVSAAFTEDLDAAMRAMTDYRRRIAVQRKADKDLPVQYNDYMHANWSDPRPERLLRQIDAAQGLGMKYFVIDAGWYSDGDWWDTLGEWREAETRFAPYSLSGVLDVVRQKGMRAGLWLEIESVGVRCPLAERLAPLCMRRYGKRVIDHERYFLDFSLPQTRQYATGVIDRLLADYGISYIKMDYNVDCSVGCDNAAESFGQGLLAHNRAYLAWVDEVQEKYPYLIMECCASGGMRLDAATLSRHAIANTSDQIYYNRNPYILCNLMATLLPERTGAWCYPRAEETDEQVVMNLVNAMLFRMQLSGEIEQLPPASTARVREGLSVYESLSAFKQRAYPYLPLGMCRFFDGTVAFGLRTADRLVLCVYGLEGGDRKKEIPLTGLAPKSARVLFPQGTATQVSLQGERLTVTLDCGECARVVDIALGG